MAKHSKKRSPDPNSIIRQMIDIKIHTSHTLLDKYAVIIVCYLIRMVFVVFGVFADLEVVVAVPVALL